MILGQEQKEGRGLRMSQDRVSGASKSKATTMSRRRVLMGFGSLIGATAIMGLVSCAPAATPEAPAAAPQAPAAAPQVPAAAPQSKETITLTWWNNQPMARTPGLWDAVVADIQEANPHIKIETVVIPFADFEPKIMTGLAGQNVGDLVDVHPVHAFTFAMRGALVNLNPYLRTLDFPESDYSPAWKYNHWHGKYWAVPRSDNPTVILYNKKMVAEAGLPDPYALFKEGKWDLAAWDRMITTMSTGEGDQRVFGAVPPGSTTLRLQCVWIWGANGETWNEDETRTLIADEPALKAWEYMASYTKNKWSPSPAEMNIPGGATALMGQRRVVANWPGAQFVLGGQAQFLPDDVQQEMHLVAMNTLWNGRNEVRNATNAQGIYPESKYRDDAWVAQAVTLSEKTQKRIIDARWTAPLRNSWLKSDMWIKSLNPKFEGPDIWEDAVTNVRYHAHLPRYVEIDNIVQTNFQAIQLEQKSVKEAMTDAKTEIDRILAAVSDEAKASPHLK